MSIYSIQPLVLGAVRTYPLVSRKDRKSTRLNSSHGYISYAVFCLKKKKKYIRSTPHLNPPTQAHIHRPISALYLTSPCHHVRFTFLRVSLQQSTQRFLHTRRVRHT